MTYLQLYKLVEANCGHIVFDTPIPVCGRWGDGYRLRGVLIRDGSLLVEDTYEGDARCLTWNCYIPAYQRSICTTVETYMDRLRAYDRNLF